MALKSKQTNKYICYNVERGNFILKVTQVCWSVTIAVLFLTFIFLKNLNQLDKFCLFIYSIKNFNHYSFAIGSNKSIFLSFNKFGRMINSRSRVVPHSCLNRTHIFSLHTKSTDNILSSPLQTSPLIIVYEEEKPIKSYSLKEGYKQVFYSSLNRNYVTTTHMPTTLSLSNSHQVR